ncbi:hypothetical protein AABB24_035988 [Solanum stoloniferum]|uniref:Uncharacterized protein n=1 Tax=Solanum stoloniferum TaxID=62892 RepID=A0ABD2RB85_9SOLN
MGRTNGRKQFRTKFTQNHNERMLEFTWKLQKRDEELINEFCSKIRVEKRGFKVLEIQYCGGLWEIDAPNLVSLEYTWSQIPQLKITLQCHDYLNAQWFCKLRKFLSNSPTWSHVCIDFHKHNEINLNNLQLDHIGSTPSWTF